MSVDCSLLQIHRAFCVSARLEIDNDFRKPVNVWPSKSGRPKNRARALSQSGSWTQPTVGASNDLVNFRRESKRRRCVARRLHQFLPLHLNPLPRCSRHPGQIHNKTSSSLSRPVLLDSPQPLAVQLIMVSDALCLESAPVLTLPEPSDPQVLLVSPNSSSSPP